MKQIDIEIQIIRIKKVKAIIKERFNDKIDEFAEFMNKHKHVIYAMLWDINNKNRRNITTDFARQIEDKLCLPNKFLDQENETVASSLIDFTELMKYQEILKDILDLQTKIIINHSNIKRFIK